MFQYEKRLQFPVKITKPDAKSAMAIISQYGGPDGELGASMRYFSQRYAMPVKEVKGILTDIGTEEMAHMEIVSAIIHQLTRDMTPEQIKKAGFSELLLKSAKISQESGGLTFPCLSRSIAGRAGAAGAVVPVRLRYHMPL